MLILAIILSDIAVGHLEVGEDKTIDGYLVNFGYDPAKLQAEQKTVFAINLVNGTTGEAISPDKVWIRISSSKDSVFAGNFNPENSNVAFTYTFPYADKYDIALRFFKDNNLLVEANFEIEVMGKNNFNYAYAAILLVFLAILFFVAKKTLFKAKR